MLDNINMIIHSIRSFNGNRMTFYIGKNHAKLFSANFGECAFRYCTAYRSSVLKNSFEKKDHCSKILLVSAFRAMMLTKPWTHYLVLALFIATAPFDSAQEDTVMLFKITELKSGLKLRYTLSLPRHYSHTETYPLVIALHYGGKVTPFFSKNFVTSFVEPALKDLHAIIAAPDCPSDGWANPISESAVLELILLLMEEHKIASSRVVILGYSIGGTGTWYMAARHPHVFSAAIPVSAPVNKAATPLIEHVPLHIIHGEKDELFSFSDVKEVYLEQKSRGAEIELTMVAGASHYQLARFIAPLKSTIPWIKKMWEYR